jgi:hypothetical protein
MHGWEATDYTASMKKREAAGWLSPRFCYRVDTPECKPQCRNDHDPALTAPGDYDE